jgi:hypothetical protein
MNFNLALYRRYSPAIHGDRIFVSDRCLFNNAEKYYSRNYLQDYVLNSGIFH